MTQPMALDQIYAPVRPDLDALERLFRAELSAEDPFIGELVTHVLATRGKMLRPALVCLSALAAGGAPPAPSDAGPPAASGPAARAKDAPPAGETDDRLGVAGAVELIHVASLIHDDVIDAADLRRGQASVNAVWGNQVAVLLGDFLFSKAFHMLARLRGGGLAAAMAAATVRMAQAEIIQIKYGNTPHTDERIYFGIIDGKTAALTSAACRCGALTAGARPAFAEALGAFGLEWGMAFQITDDALDVTATAEHLGKPIGSDIQTGKMTLPIIYALRDAPEPDGQRLRQILNADGALAPRDGEPADGGRGGIAPSGAGHPAAAVALSAAGPPAASGPAGISGPRRRRRAKDAPPAGRPPAAARVSALDEVQAILARVGAVDRALAVARARAERAARALDALPPSAGRDSLAALVEFVTVRTR